MLVALVEGCGSGVVVVGLAVAVTACHRSIYAILVGTFTATAVAIATVAHRGSDVVAVTVEIVVVMVVVVVVVIDRHRAVRARTVRMKPRIICVIG